MAEGVVDALELVDVDVVDGDLLPGRDPPQFLLQPLVEQRAVRQIRQRVEMGEMGDALLDAAALGDVLMGGEPAAIGERLVHDLHGTAVGRVDDDLTAPRDVAQRRLDVIVDVAGEGAGVPAMRDDLTEARARPDDGFRKAVHLDVSMVADDQPPRRVEQQKALRHVVDGLVETLLLQGQASLRGRVIPRQPPHHEEKQDSDQEHRDDADADQKAHLILPVGKRRRRRRGHKKYNRRYCF